MVVAALVFELGICRDDPDRLLRMPIRRILYWYDLGAAWRKVFAEAQAAARRRPPFVVR